MMAKPVNNDSTAGKVATTDSAIKDIVPVEASSSAVSNGFKFDIPTIFNGKDFWEYSRPRFYSSLAIGCLAGGTYGFYIGGKMPLYFYYYGFTNSILGASFFSISYLSKGLRGKDDFLNTAISGAITVGCLNFPSGARKGLIGTALGGTLGALYWISGVYLYDTSRKAWLRHRRFILKNSLDKSELISRRLRIRPPGVAPKQVTAKEVEERRKAEGSNS